MVGISFVEMIANPVAQPRREGENNAAARASAAKMERADARASERADADVEAANEAETQPFVQALDAQNAPQPREIQPRKHKATTDGLTETHKTEPEDAEYFQQCAQLCVTTDVIVTHLSIVPPEQMNLSVQELHVASVAFIPEVTQDPIIVPDVLLSEMPVGDASGNVLDGLTDQSLELALDITASMSVAPDVLVTPEIAVPYEPAMMNRVQQSYDVALQTSGSVVPVIQHPVRSLMHRWLELTSNMSTSASLPASADGAVTDIQPTTPQGNLVLEGLALDAEQVGFDMKALLEQVRSALEPSSDARDGVSETTDIRNDRILHARDFFAARDEGLRLVTQRDHAPILRPVQLVVMQMSHQRSALGGGQKITLQLYPEELGRVDIDMRIDTDNRAIVRISADRSETLDVLRTDRAELERLLQQSGLKLDQQSLEFNQREAYPQNDEQSGETYAGGSRDDVSSTSSNDEIEQVSITHEGLWLMSGVNIRV